MRVTGSGLGCGDKDQWPLCQGSLLPPLQQTALIEFTHRWVAAVATVPGRRPRGRRVGALPQCALAPYAVSVVVALFILQIVLGAITVEFNLPERVIMIHLANALLLLGRSSGSRYHATARSARPRVAAPWHAWPASPPARRTCWR